MYTHFDFIFIKTDCYVLDLRKDTWEWDDTVLPPLENTLSSLGMEYVKKTHEIWIVGGYQYSGYAKRDVRNENIFNAFIKFIYIFRLTIGILTLVNGKMDLGYHLK